MLKNNLILILIFYCNIIFSQDNIYITYSLPDNKNLDSFNRQHHIILQEKVICIKLFGKGDLIPEKNICFDYTLQDNVILIGQKIPPTSNDGMKDYISREFENQKIIRISENELLLEKVNRPYFSEKFIYKLRGNKMVFSINGSVEKYSEEKGNEILKYYQKKGANIKLVEGEKSYKKYGAIGINFVIEITDK
jgi:hypothetical protein